MAELEHQDDFVLITLEGPGVQPGRINLGALAVLGESLQRAVQRITLVLHRGTSSHRGPMSRELRDLTSIDLVGIEKGSVKLKLASANKRISSDVQLMRAMDILIEGLDIITNRRDGEELPTGFDYGVVQALKPIASLHTAFGVNVMSLDSRNGARKEATFREPDWELLTSLPAPTRPPVARIVGRLLMADMKTNHCRIYDAGGASRLVPFAQDLSGEVRRALRGWIEGELTSAEGADKETLVALTVISDEEADELAPPREKPWPKSVLRTLHGRATTAKAVLEDRPRWPEYRLDD